MRALLATALALAACGHPASPRSDGAAAPVPVIDRFSDAAGHLQNRSRDPSLPAPGAPVDFDRGPFITQGLAPNGASIRYYNFDIQPTQPTTLYRFVRAGTREPIAGQLDIVDRIPGDATYSDFARIAYVAVPPAYVPNSITSAQQVAAQQLPREADRAILDCPIVPPGSTAREAHGLPGASPRALWYRGARVTCLEFAQVFQADEHGQMPTSPIYVTFVRNPGAPHGGPESGFPTEPGTVQTHNVAMSVPGDADYSPLWAVHIYDDLAFPRVHDEASALAAPLLEPHGPLVNCPIVSIAAH